MMDMGYPLHLIDLLAKLYRKQLAKVKVAGNNRPIRIVSC